MSDARALATERMRGLRSQLARIELAASRLARESPAPSVRDLTRSISTAVEEMDREIDRIAALLGPANRGRGVDDLRFVLARLDRRIAPVLSAAGTAWDPPPDVSHPVYGDAQRVEATALALLRAGARIAGRGGRLRLELVGDEERHGLALECRPRESAPPGAARDFLDDVLPLVAAHGGSVETRNADGASIAQVWFAGGDPCTGS